jgi:hypothetical protein
MLATLDYGDRVVRLGPSFEVKEDIEAERARVEEFFASVKGKRPRAV